MAGKRTFASRAFAPWTFNSGHWTGVGTGTAPVIPAYTGAALDYYCQNSRPFYNAPNTRPFYGVLASDAWYSSLPIVVTPTDITQENGFAILLEDGGTLLQE
jgi:hypothetical protein